MKNTCPISWRFDLRKLLLVTFQIAGDGGYEELCGCTLGTLDMLEQSCLAHGWCTKHSYITLPLFG